MDLAWYFWVLILAAALFFAWICAAIADRNERSGLGFGILSFFGFIIIFVAVFNVFVA